MLEVKLFIDDGDIYDGEQMVEAVLKFLLHNNIKGATVFDGRIGFGKHHHLYSPKLIGSTDAQPLMIMFIDDEYTIRGILPNLKKITGDSLITLNSAEAY
jgi:PII-like signaling protein